MHLEGDFTKYLPKGQLMIHHGQIIEPKQGTKGGIAIILSEEFKEGWNQGGYNKERRTIYLENYQILGNTN